MIDDLNSIIKLRDLRFNNVQIKFWSFLLVTDYLVGILFLVQPPKKEHLIAAIRNMPDYTMRSWHGIYLEGSNKDERKAIRFIREQYRCTASWLEFYLVEETHLDFEVKLKPAIYYKSFAERDLSFLKLAQEVYVLSAWAQEHIWSPLFWMFRIKAEICEAELQHSWFGSNSQVFGKSVMYKQAIDYYDSLLYVHKFIRSEEELSGKNYTKALLGKAILIAKKNQDFRNDYWEKFLKEQKGFYRKVKNTPGMSVVVMEDGELRILGNGNRGKDTTKRKGKGFG